MGQNVILMHKEKGYRTKNIKIREQRAKTNYEKRNNYRNIKNKKSDMKYTHKDCRKSIIV